MTPGTTITAAVATTGSHHPGTATKDLSVVERDATVGAGVACAGCEVVACGGDQDSAPSRRNLLTALRAPSDLWISGRPWHSAERVEDSRDNGGHDPKQHEGRNEAPHHGRHTAYADTSSPYL